MLCEKCQKNQATVHMQQYVGNMKTEHHYCAVCSITAEMPPSVETLFEGLFQGFLDSILSAPVSGKSSPAMDTPSIKCETCGMTYDMLKTSGKVGCADCYHTFTSEMNALLKSVQGSIRHEGKFPQRSGAAIRQKREIDRLRTQLEKAVEAENYETAAGIRDRIRALSADVKEETAAEEAGV